MLGSIEEVTSSTQLVFQSRSQTETVILKLTKSTSYQDHQGEEARRSDFEESMQVLMVGYKDEDDSIVNVLRALAPFSPETAN